MVNVVLTGPIGAGKSTVAEFFRANGVPVIDADAVARDLTGDGSPLLADIEEAFPGTVIGGRLDRQKLAGIVFADPAAKARLESMTHPAIREEMERQKGEYGNRLHLSDIPLLVETGRGFEPAIVIVVDALEEVRVRRLIETRGMSDKSARERLDAQARSEERNLAADILLVNNGTLNELTAQCEQALARLRAAQVMAGGKLVKTSAGTEADARRFAAKIAYHGGEAWQEGTSLTVRGDADVMTAAGFVDIGGCWHRIDPEAHIDVRDATGGRVGTRPAVVG